MEGMQESKFLSCYSTKEEIGDNFMVPLFDKSKKEALNHLASWRKQLLVLFDSECVDAQEDFDLIYREIHDFAKKIFIDTVPTQLERFEQIPQETGYSRIDSVDDEKEKQQLCRDTIISLDDLLDGWFVTIKGKGLPPPKSPSTMEP
jgi:hypothetical protein